MSGNRSRIRRADVDHLCDGRPAGPDQLVDLLAAAAAPGRPDELAGEAAALAAFRSAHHQTALQPRRRSMIKTALAKMLTLKVAAAAAAATAAAGGVAYAANSGSLPGMGNDHSVTRSAEANAPAGSEEKNKGKGPGEANGSPSPSLVGLCRAYGDGRDHGKALENPAFRALITAAGGVEKVTDYCTDLLEAEGKTKPENGNGTGGKPSTAPGAGEQQGGKPSTQPGADAKPTARPTR